MKKPILILMTLFFGLQVTLGQSQSVQQVKDKAYGGNVGESFVFFLIDEDGTRYNATSSGSPAGTGNKTAPHYGGDYDIWLYKTGSNDNILWDRSFGGTDDDIVLSVHEFEKRLYLVSTSLSPTSGNRTAPLKGNADIWVVKTDLEGNKIWDRSYGGSGSDFVTCSAILEDGSILLGGRSNSPASGDKSQDNYGTTDIWIVKIDSAGNLLWEKTYGGSEMDILNALAVDNDGNIALAAMSISPQDSVKTAPEYGLFGHTWVLKLNDSGELIDQTSFGGDGTEDNPDLLFAENRYYLLMESDSEPSGNKTSVRYGSDMWLLQLDKELNIQWQKTIGGDDVEGNPGIAFIEDDEILLFCGTNSSSSSGNLSDAEKYGLGHERDYLIVSADTAGEINWMFRTGGSHSDRPSDAGKDISGNIIAGGFSSSPISGTVTDEAGGGLGDNWFVWLDVPVFVNEHKSEEHRLTLYPNPAVNEVRFELKDNTAFEHYSLLSITGNEIERGKVTSGTNAINTSSLPSGIYLIRLTGEGRSFTKRVVKR